MSHRNRESWRTSAMRKFVCMGIFAFALAAMGCEKQNDPRCADVARSSKMAGIAALEERYEGEQLESLKAQIEAQTEKIERECQEMLADDETGLWDRWADCMVAATDAAEVRDCKKVE